jgi:hydrogenase maturation protease HycI
LLNQALTNHLVTNSFVPKIAILGIGNELNGDDGAGVLVARKIKQALSFLENLLIFEGSIAPENFSGPIRKFNPDWIWLIDAAEINRPAGHIEFISLEEIDGVTVFSHGLPLSIFGKYLQSETGASVILFGIQPENLEPFTQISEVVGNSIDRLSEELVYWLKNNIINLSL